MARRSPSRRPVDPDAAALALLRTLMKRIEADGPKRGRPLTLREMEAAVARIDAAARLGTEIARRLSNSG